MAWDRSPNEKDSEERIAVVVSRHWDNPKITVTLNREKIEVMCGLNDFVSALADEMPHPMKVWRRKKQRTEALAAMLRAVEKVKQATAQVM